VPDADLSPVDLAIIGGYLLLVLLLGALIHRRATRGTESFFLAGRSLPWWVLGLAGCSSYIDVGGTMAMVGLMWFTGLQSIWITHLFWGWFILAGYMAFQARWIRRSGVMTFAEWNRARFGEGPDTEVARTATALFLLVLMVFNLGFIAVGVGKFAGTFVPNLPDWGSTLIVFGVVGAYTAMGGFFGVVLTDILQTVLIVVAAVALAWMAWQAGDPSALVAAKDPAWASLWPQWELWDGYATSAPAWFAKFGALGPLLLAVSGWVLVRVLAGPNVWEFQFFLTARSPRDAQLAAGLWTVGYTFRWILGAAFLVLGMHQFADAPAGFDSERIMPEVLAGLEHGVRGAFLALLLAALMSTLDAMVNVTSAVVVHDLLERTVARGASQRRLVRMGQLASLGALGIGFGLSFWFESITDVWETMIFVVVTVILVPSMLRWHWWRFSARAYTLGMGASAVGVLAIALSTGDDRLRLPLSVAWSLAACVALGRRLPPAPEAALLRFYASVRPFGVWRPVREAAVRQGLVPEGDRQPRYDLANLGLALVLQVALALVPIYALLRMWTQATVALGVVAAVGLLLAWTWRATLPARAGR
jgi:Na+/proline symporter